MPVDKIGNINQTVSTQKVESKPQEQQKQVDEPDKGLSDSAKFMIGATILAGTVAVGIIGHKNNWWRKAAQEGQNLANNSNISHTTQTASQASAESSALPNLSRNAEVQATESAQAAKETVVDTTERLVQRVNSTFSKELKHAKRSLKQYNEVMESILETNKNFGGDYVKYLESKGFTAQKVNNEVYIRDSKGSLVQVINNPTEGNRLRQPSYIEFYGKDGKISKTVSFVNEKSSPFIFYYDKNGQISKRITPMLKVGCLNKPHIFVTNMKNGRVTKEAIYIQPFKEGVDGDYTTSKVLNIAKYSKKRVFEAGKMSLGDSPRYVFVGEKPYLIKPDNSLENCDIGNIFLNDRRAFTFNKNNEIIQRLEIKETGDSVVINKYHAYDSRTGYLAHELKDKNGMAENYTVYNPSTSKATRRVLEDLDNPEIIMDIPFDSTGKAIKEQIQSIPRTEFDTASLYDSFKTDFAPDRIMQPNR